VIDDIDDMLVAGGQIRIARMAVGVALGLVEGDRRKMAGINVGKEGRAGQTAILQVIGASLGSRRKFA
jgi:hypothetical protein